MLLVTPSNVTGILKKKHDRTQIGAPKTVRFISDHVIEMVDDNNTNQNNMNEDQAQVYKNIIDADDVNARKMSRTQDIIYGMLMSILIIGGSCVGYYFMRRKCSNKAANSIDTQRRNGVITEAEPEII